MKHITAVIYLSLAMLFAGASMSWSDDLQKGLDAYEKTDYFNAHRLLTPLAEQGNAAAQMTLGDMYLRGQRVETDMRVAKIWYKRAAEQGNAAAQVKFGLLFERGLGVTRDMEHAIQWYTLAAEQGDADALRILVSVYHYGRKYNDVTIIPQDDETSKQWLSRLTDLAEQGGVNAQVELGEIYERGIGVTKNAGIAAKWYILAAEQGNADDQYRLGDMYRKGQGVPPDYGAAMKWYTLAAEQGHADAQFAVGQMYSNGDGVPQDDGMAAKWYILAAEQAQRQAQYDLGKLYQMGRGVKKDYVRACVWWLIARWDGGSYDAGKLADDLMEWMIDNEIKEVYRRKDECDKVYYVNRNYKGCME